MNKICTDIEQSKKLIELGIDVKTADMVYLRDYFDESGEYCLIVGSYHEGYKEKDDGTLVPIFEEHIPAWSLSALLGNIPVYLTKEDKTLRLQIDMGLDDFDIWYEESGLAVSELDCISEDFVDACVEMIVKLHEKGLL